MNRLVISLIIAVLAITGSAKKTTKTSDRPDFAFPEKVSATASADLRKALAAGNGPEIVNAFIQKSLAQSLIDADRLPASLAELDSIRRVSKDETTVGILSLLKAYILNSVYDNNKWNYDQRKLPLRPFAADYTEWSGEQFTDTIRSLVAEAIRPAAAYQKIPVGDWRACLKIDNDSELYYPTLFDFVSWEALNLLGGDSPSTSYIPSGFILRPTSYDSYPYISPATRQVLDLYNGLTAFHADQPAPYILSELARILYINGDRSNVADEILRLYKRFEDSEFCGIIFESAGNYFPQNREYYDLAVEYKKRFPSSRYVPVVDGIINTLTWKNLTVSMNCYASASCDFKIQVESENVSKGRILVYKVDPKTSYYKGIMRNKIMSEKPVAEIPFEASGSVPFKDTITVNYRFPAAGVYVVTADFDGIASNSERKLDYVYVTDLMGFTTSLNETNIWAVNPVTGRPVPGAKLFEISDRYRGVANLLGETDSEGKILYDKVDWNPGYLQKDNSYSPSFNLIRNHTRTDNYRQSAVISTSLNIYHPGDTVEYSIVSYRYKIGEAEVETGKLRTVTLYDANGQKVASEDVTTDDFGRASGNFTLPTGGLTGNFHLEVTTQDENDRTKFLRQLYFMVSDYKLPTYALTDLKVLKDTPSKGTVTVEGKAITYSGFPLTDGQVKVSLSSGQRFWFWDTTPAEYYTTDTQVGPGGRFSVEFPSELLDNAPYPDGLFTARFNVTSATGETHGGSVSFSNKASYAIVANVPASIDIARPVKFEVKVNDQNGVQTALPVEISLSGDTFSGTFTTPDPTVDLTGVPSGTYTLKISTSDTTLCQPVSQKVTLYRPTDAAAPSPEVFWTPTTRLSVEKSEAAKILYSTSAPEITFLVSVADKGKMISQKWVTGHQGMNTLEVALPDDALAPRINIAGFCQLQTVDVYLDVKVDKAVPAITVKTESFRDRLTPGAEETWSFTVRNQNGEAVRAALMFDMYNKALNDLGNGQAWEAPNFLRSFYNTLNTTIVLPWSSAYYSGVRHQSPSYDMIQPVEFQTYGKLFGRPNIRIRGMYMKESAEADEVMVEAPAPMMMKAAPASANSMADGGAELGELKEEVVVSGYDAGSGKPEGQAFAYRDAETPLALWRPVMTTDADGNLTLSYRVPNANTTWMFNAFAWTRDLLSDTFQGEAVASKPVMVQPNLPRFIRVGDRATLLASVMNNSEEVQTVKTLIEIFNPSTGEVVDSKEYNNTIQPDSSAVVSIDVAAPSQGQLLGYRVKSSTDAFADGEQTLLPVLPSVQPVIETSPFWMAPDQQVYNGTIPGHGADARVVLTFTENPTWEIVTALPGILKGEAKTAPDAVAAIYAAAIADGIMRDNPNIATELRRWLDSDRQDSTLVSMLQRNADLKTFVLGATPWVQAAENDTERMTRLALLFDRGAIERVYATNIDLLTKLQLGSGAFRWIADSDYPSYWSTERVLFLLGDLQQTGNLPGDRRLKKMIASALSYVDAETVKEFKKYPKSDFSEFAYLHTYYPEAKVSTAAQRVISTAVQRLLGDWKQLDVPGKAQAAIILNHNKYQSSARQILESLREYSVYKPERGMYWPSLDRLSWWSAYSKVSATAFALDAFAQVDPGCQDIDRIRQWLIFEKEAQNWGSSTATTAVISSFLSSSKRFVAPARGAVITVGGREIEQNGFQRTTGSFRSVLKDIPAVGTDFTVYRPGDFPSWGSVYVQYEGKMADVEASAIDGVSIEKTLYRIDGRTVTDGLNSFEVGDRVRVDLLIKVDRDIDYVAIDDQRPACFEPVEQMPRPVWIDGVCFYRENRDSATNLFITHLKKGTYRLTYDMNVTVAGQFSSGIATLQSQYCPALSAHSAGATITVK